MYWTDHGTNQVLRCPIEAPATEVIVSDTGAQFFGLATASADNRLFWGVNSQEALIRTSSLNGQNASVLVPGVPHMPCGAFVVDEVHDELYYMVWVPAQGRKFQIHRTNYKTGMTQVVVDPEAGIAVAPVGVDARAGRLYWLSAQTDADVRIDDPLSLYRKAYPNELWCGDLNGGDAKCLIPASVGLKGMIRAVIDTEAGKIYWTQNYPGWKDDKVRRASLDGTGIEDVCANETEARRRVSYPFGIDLDLHRGKVYWADINANWIARCNPDGTGFEVVQKATASPGVDPHPTCLKLARIRR
jgi:hypothetical protein